MSFQLLCKQDEAHDDSIWSVAWCSNSLDGIEYILTGGADGVVKVKSPNPTYFQPDLNPSPVKTRRKVQ